jgi:hypothetical protein
MLPFWIEVPFGGVMQLLTAFVAALALLATHLLGHGL